MKQFENLEDPNVYDQCEQWWIDEFNKRFQGDFIINYLNQYSNDGTKCRDGNPIFCASKENQEAHIIQQVRVILDDVGNNLISAWFDYRQQDLNINTIELVIYTLMVKENTNQAFTWIKNWFDNNLTEKDLQDHFDNNTKNNYE